MSSVRTWPRMVSIFADDVKKNEGKIMFVAEEGCLLEEVKTFVKENFGVTYDISVLSASGVEVKPTELMKEQLYIFTEAFALEPVKKRSMSIMKIGGDRKGSGRSMSSTKGGDRTGSATLAMSFFQPQIIKRGPKEGWFMGNFGVLFSGDGLSNTVEKLVHSFGSPIKITGPGGVLMSYTFSDPDQVAVICDDEVIFTKNRPPPNSALGVLRAREESGLFTAGTEEEQWGIGHRIFLPSFSLKNMKEYLPAINLRMRALSEKYAEFGSTYFDVPECMTRMTYDSIALALMSVEFKSVEDAGTDKLHDFIKSMSNFLECGTKIMGSPISSRFSGLKAERDEYYNKMCDLCRTIIADRRALLASGKRPDHEDMLQVMLEGTDTVTARKLTDDEMISHLNTFLVAGHETTSGLLSFAWHHIAMNPHVEDRAQVEVDSVLGKDANLDITWQQVSQLKYIEQICWETLRLHPTAPGFQRQATVDTVIGGYAIKAGDRVSVTVQALHHDPRCYPDPLTFNPDRFEKETRQKREARFPHCFKPFGSGMRACIGMQFAMMEAKVVIAKTIQRYRLRHISGYVLRTHQALTVKPSGLMMNLHPRDFSKSPTAFELPPMKTPASAPTPVSPRGSARGRSTTPLDLKVVDIMPVTGSKTYILYGSNMGSSKDFAIMVEREAAGHGYVTVLLSLDEALASTSLADAGVVIIVTATYNGYPPDNAVKFDKWLDSPTAKLPSGTRYAVFGCGNTNWVTFQKFPKKVDAKLAEMGGVRFQRLGQGDAAGEFEEPFDAWLKTLWNSLSDALGSYASTVTSFASESFRLGISYSVEPFASPAGGPSTVVIEDSVNGILLGNSELQGPGSGRSTRLITVQLPESITYLPGDHLVVFPHNHNTNVEALARRLELDLEALILVKCPRKVPGSTIPIDTPVTVRGLLTQVLDIMKPPNRAALTTLAHLCPCPPERIQLEEMGKNPAKYKEEVAVPRLTLWEILDKFKSVPAFGMDILLTIVSTIKPRYYSISSSPLATRGEHIATITVGQLNATLPTGRTHRGVASTYLGDLIEVGTKLEISVRANIKFRLPSEAEIPIVMICAGTGLSPFMGFLEHRAALLKSGIKVGLATLIFGCRSSAHDYLYKEDLQKYLETGVLSDLFVALSREPDTKKQYVQDVVAIESIKIASLISSGAVVFVCGDAKDMAPAVRSAVGSALVAHGGASEAASVVRDLVSKARYVEDCWSAA